jgi:hypothetical protein
MSGLGVSPSGRAWGAFVTLQVLATGAPRERVSISESVKGPLLIVLLDLASGRLSVQISSLVDRTTPGELSPRARGGGVETGGAVAYPGSNLRHQPAGSILLTALFRKRAACALTGRGDLPKGVTTDSGTSRISTACSTHDSKAVTSEEWRVKGQQSGPISRLRWSPSDSRNRRDRSQKSATED